MRTEIGPVAGHSRGSVGPNSVSKQSIDQASITLRLVGAGDRDERATILGVLSVIQPRVSSRQILDLLNGSI
jgi:hypothetical protein